MRRVQPGTLLAVGLVVVAASAGCTGSSTPSPAPPGPTRTSSSPRPPAATGVVTGRVPLCLAILRPAAVPARSVRVRVTSAGHVVATQRVTASGRRPGRYRFTLPPGRYLVETPREHDGPVAARVTAGSTVTVDLSNGCK